MSSAKRVVTWFKSAESHVNMKVLFISRLTHSWCCLLNPGATTAALMYLPLQHMARESCKLHRGERTYLLCPPGSHVSGCCIVNGEHYEVFAGREMTEQCAERANHGSQRGEKRAFRCRRATASDAHSKCHAAAAKEGGFFPTALSAVPVRAMSQG